MHYGDDDWQKQNLWQIAKQLRDFRGEKFLSAVTLVLSRLFDVRFAFISVALQQQDMAQTLFVADRGNSLRPFQYRISTAPCQQVFHGQALAIPCELAQHYVDEAGLQSYIGAPLPNRAQKIIGVLAIADEKVMVGEQRILQLLQLLTAQVSAELELHLLAQAKN